MKIVSIDKKETKDKKNVTFHILEKPSARAIKIFKQVKLGGLSISVDGTLLTVTSGDHHINDENIKLILKTMNESTIKADQEEKEEIAAREQMLNEISVATNISLAK